MRKGMGAQIELVNSFADHFTEYEIDPLTGETEKQIELQLFKENPKSALSKNDSPDMSFKYSINAYQGCEHGCVYCYARNSHEYWGFNISSDFERKLVYKESIAQKLEKEFLKKSWKPQTVMLSGNTDCYQPLEKKMELTRGILKIFNKYQNPVGIVTKNALIQRDVDVLSELAQTQKVHVFVSMNSLDEQLRRKLEPRTSTHANRLKTIEVLRKNGIPSGVLVSPVIPGLTDHEIPNVLRQANEAGALTAAYTTIRLNKSLDKLFVNWLEEHYPNKKAKVINLIKEIHGGNLNNSEWGERMRGTGEIAGTARMLFNSAFKKYFNENKLPPLSTSGFRRQGNYQLF